MGAVSGWAEPSAVAAEPAPHIWSLDTAVRWAIQYNPELAALRERHGIAAAGVVIARTYPFNPVWEAKVRAATGPESAGITNVVSNEHKLLFEVEIRGQGTYRREAAFAALTRTDWEIASQELVVAVRVVRAFDAVLYRREKVRLIEATIRLNEQAAEQVRKLREAGKLGAAELLLARTEVDDARAQLGTGRTALVTAGHELRRAIGVVDGPFELQGTLTLPPGHWDSAAVTEGALQRRPDLHARQAAVAEADAHLRLEIANRYGNPNVGPAYEYDPTRINLIGAQIALPLPVFNTRRGEILQREAERNRAALELGQIEVQVRQDVQAALARLDAGRAGVNTYRTEVLPSLQTSLEEMERLFAQAGVDVLRVIDVRRKLLKARDGYLDAVWEVSQARADLVAAAGDLDLIFSSYTTPQSPEALSPPKP